MIQNLSVIKRFSKGKNKSKPKLEDGSFRELSPVQDLKGCQGAVGKILGQLDYSKGRILFLQDGGTGV